MRAPTDFQICLRSGTWIWCKQYFRRCALTIVLKGVWHPVWITPPLVCPLLFPEPVHSKEVALHSLNVVWLLWVFLNVLSRFCRLNFLFMQEQAKYCCKLLTARSTGAASASWTFFHQALISQICKAVTWLSVQAFTKFYTDHVAASTNGSFWNSLQVRQYGFHCFLLRLS